jgi:GDP-L-fucose synthase
MQSHINVGFGSDLTIAELAQAMSHPVGYPGGVTFDASKPDGVQRKLMFSARINALGWRADVDMRQGLQRTYLDFLKT